MSQWMCAVLLKGSLIKLKLLTRALQSWSQKQLALARELLQRLEIVHDHLLLSLDDWLRCELKRQCLVLASHERTEVHLRSWVLTHTRRWCNTSFFHKQSSFRKRTNFIPKLVNGDPNVTSQEDKHQVLFDYYEGLLGTAMPRDSTMNLQLFHRFMDVSVLEAPFSEEEI